MCWSAEADLVAGGAVAAVGVGAALRAGWSRRLPLAALPLLLGAHQLVEAGVWAGWGWARTVWAVVALPLLPLYVPAAVWCATRRRAAARFTLLGAAVAVPLAVALARRPVAARPHGHTLVYAVGVPASGPLLAGYLVAVLGALLCSGDRRLRLLGWIAGLGALVCGLLWRLAFVSTWCALAAVASVLLYRWADVSASSSARASATEPPGSGTG
ncbi:MULTISPECIES: DUF6629 family protein [Kitasatospora]|uniref:Integral membrane protein n=1 Tax=Kitasatospora setae (strain ATCC 33774 / DSM 43861 / JCM 3304 / KCC A-0304 / NBRC 14216 / KM-6054) TaxID=452652 RepID=E4N638_KITSK|nr:MULTISPECIES: DUF6629 family protein [Kitasatospora]BAJ26669.1 hypothetical protein KSE_08300 [Kitasatospora setae KM-6054]